MNRVGFIENRVVLDANDQERDVVTCIPRIAGITSFCVDYLFGFWQNNRSNARLDLAEGFRHFICSHSLIGDLSKRGSPAPYPSVNANMERWGVSRVCNLDRDRQPTISIEDKITFDVGGDRQPCALLKFTGLDDIPITFAGSKSGLLRGQSLLSENGGLTGDRVGLRLLLSSLVSQDRYLPIGIVSLPLGLFCESSQSHDRLLDVSRIGGVAVSPIGYYQTAHPNQQSSASDEERQPFVHGRFLFKLYKAIAAFVIACGVDDFGCAYLIFRFD